VLQNLSVRASGDALKRWEYVQTSWTLDGIGGEVGCGAAAMDGIESQR